MIAFLAIMLLTANGIEDKYTPENYICDPAYAEYESCESTNVMKKCVQFNFINFFFQTIL